MRQRSVARLSAATILALGGAQAMGADLEAVHLTSTITQVRSLDTLGPRTPAWRASELDRITEANDFHVATYRDNHVTMGTPNWTWSVAVDGELYVRAYNGTRSSWYQSAVRERAGQISAAGMKKLVAFEPVQGPINDRIDAAYRAKYGSSKYLDAMLSARASAATLRIRPAE
jgi:hypothetical protein